MLAPLNAAATAAARLPSSRSSGPAAFNILPINALREMPTNSGCPTDFNDCKFFEQREIVRQGFTEADARIDNDLFLTNSRLVSAANALRQKFSHFSNDIP